MKKRSLLFLLSALLLSSCTFAGPFESAPSTSEGSESNENLSEESESTSSEVESESESESESEQESTSESEKESETTPSTSESEEENEEEDLYELFYNTQNKIEIKLDFTNEAIYKLAKYSEDENRREMYHPVDVTITINGKEYFYEECGARMKGNTSRNPNYVGSDGRFARDDSGAKLVHYKISFNQTFDDPEDNDYYVRTWDSKDERTARKDRRFGGAKKFDIKYNKCQDGTYTKQMYSYNAFRSEGMLAEKNNLVKTTINTESDSVTAVYLAQECIDKEFLKRHFASAEAKGNLYKCTYTHTGKADLTSDALSNNKIGVEGPNYHPSYDLKTNDDPEEIDHTLINNLVTTINNDKSQASEFKSTLDSLIDVDAFLRYSAMCWVMGNPDDLRNNYNNYYLYFNSKTNKAIFIPYDYDRCLGILQDWEIHMESTPYHTTKAPGSNREWQRNPLLWRTILRTKSGETSSEGLAYSRNYPCINEYREQYVEYCIEYANKYLSTAKFEEFTNNVYYADKNANKAGGSNITFAEYASKKLNTFTENPDN